MKEQIILGKWTEGEIDLLLKKASAINDTGSRIAFLSEQFLDVKYKESTLIGNASTPEMFVINLEGIDCFTFLDYIEAMRLSNSFAGFRDNLKKVRYHSENITYENRNHFFTDWPEFNPALVEDITGNIAAGKSKVVIKTLNKKDDGTYFLPGVSCREREITYLPSAASDDIVENLQTGDYTGIYSEKTGLDVSHAGIMIRKGGKLLFRHASSSSKNRKVIDEDFIKYISGKPGIIVLRPK